MPGLGDRFQINAAEVVADIIDGEAIIMNLSKGIYYSLDQSGAAIWGLLAAGASVAETADAICRRYEIPSSKAMEDIGVLATQLVEEGMLLAAAGPALGKLPGLSGGHAAEPYRTPMLNKYSDMKDLLALDPPIPEFKGLPQG